MGQKYSEKHLPLCRRRYSLKKKWKERRKRLRELARLNETQAKSVAKLTVKSVSDINSKIESENLHCLTSQVAREEVKEEPVETYKEENILSGNIKYCKNEDNLFEEVLIVNSQGFLDEEKEEEKVEIYEEEIEIYEEETQEDTCIENIECEVEIHEEEDTDNRNTEYHKNLIVGNNSLSDKINNRPLEIFPAGNIPEGRNIVDVYHMWSEIQRTFNDHAQKTECQFKYWQLVHHRRCGLLMQLFFQCYKCKYFTNIWTDPKPPKTKDINAASAAACVEARIGYTQMRKLCETMDIKYMSEPTYINNRNKYTNQKANVQSKSTKSA